MSLPQQQQQQSQGNQIEHDSMCIYCREEIAEPALEWQCGTCSLSMHGKCQCENDRHRAALPVFRTTPALCPLAHPLAGNIRLRQQWQGLVIVRRFPGPLQSYWRVLGEWALKRYCIYYFLFYCIPLLIAHQSLALWEWSVGPMQPVAYVKALYWLYWSMDWFFWCWTTAYLLFTLGKIVHNGLAVYVYWATVYHSRQPKPPSVGAFEATDVLFHNNNHYYQPVIPLAHPLHEPGGEQPAVVGADGGADDAHM